MTKKNEIYIQKSREGYSLKYREKDVCREPEIIINSMNVYDIIGGLLGMSKNIYKKGINKIYFNEYDFEIPEKERKIFKGVINILEKSAIGNKNLEDKIKEINKILINKKNKKEFLIKEISRNEKESFNSLYKIAKKYKTS